MTPEQKDMLKTLKEHGSVSAVSYRLSFEPELQKWARTKGFVGRIRGQYKLTSSGNAALSSQSRE
jgi:hypothetical protein